MLLFKVYHDDRYLSIYKYNGSGKLSMYQILEYISITQCFPIFVGNKVGKCNIFFVIKKWENAYKSGKMQIDKHVILI